MQKKVPRSGFFVGAAENICYGIFIGKFFRVFGSLCAAEISMDCTPVNRDKSEEAINKMAVVNFGDKDRAVIADISGQKKFSAENSAAIVSHHHLSFLSFARAKPAGAMS